MLRRSRWRARWPAADGRVVPKAIGCRDEVAAVASAREYERRFADPSYATAAAETSKGEAAWLAVRGAPSRRCGGPGGRSEPALT